MQSRDKDKDKERAKKMKRLSWLRDVVISKTEAAARRREEGDEEIARRFLFDAQNLKKEMEALEKELRPCRARYVDCG